MSLATMLLVAVLAFLSLASLACAAVAVYAARQARVANLPDVVALRGVALEARQEVAELRAEWKANLGAMDAVMEALDDKAETVQRRRKRAEMAERRRAEGAGELEAEPDPMNAALQRARAQGLPV